jgi:hypothetical protein
MHKLPLNNHAKHRSSSSSDEMVLTSFSPEQEQGGSQLQVWGV